MAKKKVFFSYYYEKDANGNKISKDEYEKKIKEKLGIEDIPEVKDLNIKKENLDAILKGMKGVTSETGGTAYYVFSDLDIDIGGKTGSAETGIKNQVNGWFAGFAPYDDPEIAIVVFIENAGAGGFRQEYAEPSENDEAP